MRCRWEPSTPTRHEFVPASSGPVASDLLDDIGDVGLRFDAVELGGLDDGIDGGSPFAASLRSGKDPVLAADRHGADRALGDVVVDLGNALVDVAGERVPALAAIVERLGHVGLG